VLNLIAGSPSRRYAARIVAVLNLIARLLLTPLRGPHRRRAKSQACAQEGLTPVTITL
jgi:hypothetical protein